jgi:hypothetical protein
MSVALMLSPPQSVPEYASSFSRSRLTLESKRRKILLGGCLQINRFIADSQHYRQGHQWFEMGRVDCPCGRFYREPFHAWPNQVIWPRVALPITQVAPSRTQFPAAPPAASIAAEYAARFQTGRTDQTADRRIARLRLDRTGNSCRSVRVFVAAAPAWSRA